MKKSELRNLIKEAISEVVSEEARMATSDLEAASHYIEHLGELVNDNSDLEDWVKAKINIAKENLRIAFEYLSYESKGQGQTAVDEGFGDPYKFNYNGVEKLFKHADISPEGYVSQSDIHAALEQDNLGINTDSDGVNDIIDDIAMTYNFSWNQKRGGYTPHVDEAKKKKWIQKSLNPKHKGYCTPMTKPTCTPARKALAKRFKKGI